VSVDPRWYESFVETEEWLLMATTRNPGRTETETAFQIVACKRQSPGTVRMG
jgi:hypothetical protein